MHPVFRPQPPSAGASVPQRFSFSALTELELCSRRWWLRHAQYDGFVSPNPEPVFAATVAGTVVHGTLKAFAEALGRVGNPAPGSMEFAEVRRTFSLRELVRQSRREALNRLVNNPRVDIATLGGAVPVDGCIAAFKRLVAQAYSGDVRAEPDREGVRIVVRASISRRQPAAGTSHDLPAYCTCDTAIGTGSTPVED